MCIVIYGGIHMQNEVLCLLLDVFLSEGSNMFRHGQPTNILNID